MNNNVSTIVRKIPYGKVTTYGTIAAMCGSPKAARLVGQLLRNSTEEIPWHRVVGQGGRITIVNIQHPPTEQVEKLRAEGVDISFQNNIYQITNFSNYLWKDYR